MRVVETYLDLVILINGGMDTLLLILLGRLIHLQIRPFRVLSAVLLGEIPVLLACFSTPSWTVLSKCIIPFIMVRVAFPKQNLGTFLKVLVGFWLLSSGLGGFMYALWGWAQFDGGLKEEPLTLVMNKFWIFPLGVLIWFFLQRLWQQWQERKAVQAQSIYDLEIIFGSEAHEAVHLKALMDTGNQLRDPLTGFPVIIMEEEVAVSAMPDNMRAFLKIPWKDYADPWPLLWNVNPDLVKRLVFIPFQTIDTKSWLLGIRPERVTYVASRGSRQIRATVALVKQVLSSEGEYQALLHPEHVQKGGDG